MRILPLLVFGFLLPSMQAADLEVVVEGIEKIEGDLRIGIFDCEEDFRTNPLEQSTTIEITEVGPVTTLIEGLPPGIYAIAVVWDLNKNGEVDTTGIFKRPTEPVAFSNAPKIVFGPPKFEDCRFELTEEGERLVMTLE
ncbi:MAG: DUF2141 domain-containing protein [Verrucomicrobiales bacterium]